MEDDELPPPPVDRRPLEKADSPVPSADAKPPTDAAAPAAEEDPDDDDAAADDELPKLLADPLLYADDDAVAAGVCRRESACVWMGAARSDVSARAGASWAARPFHTA